MKSCIDCFPCFVRQVLEAARMATDDADEQEAVLKELFLYLSCLDCNQTPPKVSAEIHNIVKRKSGVADPYYDIKRASTRFALGLVPRLEDIINSASDPFEAALRFAIAGNIIDFGAKSGVTEKDVELAVDRSVTAPICGSDIVDIKRLVNDAGRILYLGDNAGETVMDALFIGRIGPEKVTYVVKGAPIINDALYEDAEEAGISAMVEVIDNGADAPGTVLEMCSPEFLRRFESADLIISKGQGNYESLTDVRRPILFLLKPKCEPVARFAGCDIGCLLALISDAKC